MHLLHVCTTDHSQTSLSGPQSNSQSTYTHAKHTEKVHSHTSHTHARKCATSCCVRCSTACCCFAHQQPQTRQTQRFARQKQGLSTAQITNSASTALSRQTARSNYATTTPCKGRGAVNWQTALTTQHWASATSRTWKSLASITQMCSAPRMETVLGTPAPNIAMSLGQRRHVTCIVHLRAQAHAVTCRMFQTVA
jgi:hypothetical protein